MMESYVVVDVETTGLNASKDRLLEIGAVKVEKNRVIEKFETFVDARIQISSHITRLTGIHNGMIEGAPLPEEAIRMFIHFCGDLPLMGHNIMFDYSFLKKCAVDSRLSFERKGVDTLKIARKMLPGLEKKNLESLCSYYGIEQEEKHRAYYDAAVTQKLFEHLRIDFGEKEETLFEPVDLIAGVKKQGPITKSQKGYLIDLVKYHKIEIAVEIDSLTKSEASRLIDGIITKHGRIYR